MSVAVVITDISARRDVFISAGRAGVSGSRVVTSEQGDRKVASRRRKRTGCGDKTIACKEDVYGSRRGGRDGFENGRDGEIRTLDLYNPNVLNLISGSMGCDRFVTWLENRGKCLPVNASLCRGWR
jgi:hypothetical protein